MTTKPVYSKLKKGLIVFLMLILVFVGYVEIVNLNSTDMTYRQKVLKAVYPIWMWFTRLTGKNNARIAGQELNPPVSFYSLKSTLNNGQVLDFNELKGKKILLVNTASDCGYTEQYADLQKLYEEHKDKLLVIGFPANDFKEQEKGTDEEIARFCQLNFGVNFPLMKKSVVIKKPGQHDVFRWLTDSTRNGWNNKAPSWNFSKYLVNEEGLLVNYFDPSVSPMGNDIREAIGK
ncbi:MAG TPA: glutathione peroxidase [Chitinophagaceae bacterium]|nr:glutathione peroxidase [Chitinophagaceae bacterium]